MHILKFPIFIVWMYCFNYSSVQSQSTQNLHVHDLNSKLVVRTKRQTSTPSDIDSLPFGARIVTSHPTERNNFSQKSMKSPSDQKEQNGDMRNKSISKHNLRIGNHLDVHNSSGYESSNSRRFKKIKAIKRRLTSTKIDSNFPPVLDGRKFSKSVQEQSIFHPKLYGGTTYQRIKDPQHEGHGNKTVRNGSVFRDLGSGSKDYFQDGKRNGTGPNERYFQDGQRNRMGPDERYFQDGQRNRTGPDERYYQSGQRNRTSLNERYHKDGQSNGTGPNKRYYQDGQRNRTGHNERYDQDGQRVGTGPNDRLYQDGQRNRTGPDVRSYQDGQRNGTGHNERTSFIGTGITRTLYRDDFQDRRVNQRDSYKINASIDFQISKDIGHQKEEIRSTAENKDYLNETKGNKTNAFKRNNVVLETISSRNDTLSFNSDRKTIAKAFPHPVVPEKYVVDLNDVDDALPCPCFWSKEDCGCNCSGSLSYDDFQVLAKDFRPCQNFSFSLSGGLYFSLPPNLFTRVGRVENIHLKVSNSTFDYLLDPTPDTSPFKGVIFEQKCLLELDNVSVRRGWNWDSLQHLKPSGAGGMVDVEITGCGLKRLSSDFASVASGRVGNLRVEESGLEMVGSGAFETFGGMVRFRLPKNRLTSIRRTDLPANPRDLKEIDLGGNLLQSLDRDLFEEMPSLRVISLAGNPLRMLGEHTFGPVIGRAHLLGLADFPLTCDCRMRWLKNSTLSDNSLFSENLQGITCRRPPHLRGTLFKTLSKEHLMC